MTTGNIGFQAFYNCYRLGESSPETTVIFSKDQKFENWNTSIAGMGTSGGRAPVRVVNNRLKFATGTSGTPED